MLISDITEGKTTTYGYDEYGNRINKSSETQTTRYSYDKNNRMLLEETTSGAEKEIISYTYDPNGNQLYKLKNTETENIGEPELGIKLIEESDSGVEKYEYNLYNQLTKAVTNGKISTYTYDGNGLRQSKTVNGETSSQIWNGGNVVMETNGSGESIANYYYGNKLYGAKTSGKNVYYSYNGHGDTRKLTDTSGATVADYDYDAFGNQTSATESIYNPFRYNGQYTDEETGLIYLRNRYYDPQVGRFITEDPVQDGMNWYVYCVNNPTRLADPMGLKPGDLFSSPDEAFVDFGNYINKKSIEKKSEYATPIYYVEDASGNKMYTYDEPWNETKMDPNNEFVIDWSKKSYYDPDPSKNRIVAIAHSHGAYDAANNNAKDGFSLPNNSLSQAGYSDTGQSDLLGYDYYVVTPAGNGYKYTSGSGNEKGVLIDDNFYVDPNYAKVLHETEHSMSNKLITQLIKNKYKNVPAKAIIKATTKHSVIKNSKVESTNWLDVLNELEYYYGN